MLRASSIHWPFVSIAAATSAVASLLLGSATAREVLGSTMVGIFTVVTTPFILETSCTLLFLLALLAYNRHRLQKEGDGWVYLVSQEPDDKTLPPSITQRLQSTVLSEKPEPPDDTLAHLGTLEGYLELGMAAQAKAEIQALPVLPDTAETAALRFRILAANLDTDTAREQLAQSAGRFPDALPLLTHAALATARWFLDHTQHRDLAATWLQEARHLAQAPILLPADDPLKKLEI